jgi:hypothetical protein
VIFALTHAFFLFSFQILRVFRFLCAGDFFFHCGQRTFQFCENYCLTLWPSRWSILMLHHTHNTIHILFMLDEKVYKYRLCQVGWNNVFYVFTRFWFIALISKTQMFIFTIIIMNFLFVLWVCQILAIFNLCYSSICLWSLYFVMKWPFYHYNYPSIYLIIWTPLDYFLCC